MLDYLERRTSVLFAPPPVHPDYRDLPGAAAGGRALATVPFDGRLLGADFERVRPPRREFGQASLQAWNAADRAIGSRYLFPSRLHASPHISIRQYARLVYRWVESIGLDSAFSPRFHRMRCAPRRCC
jgi:hypothetical protein